MPPYQNTKKEKISLFVFLFLMPEVNILDYRKAHRNKKKSILMSPSFPMVPFLIKAVEFRIVCFHVNTYRETGWARIFPQQKAT